MRHVIGGLAIAILVGVACPGILSYGQCQTKCRSGTYFTTNGMDKWVVVTDDAYPPDITSCRRIWRTDDPEQDIVGGVEIVRRRRELGGFATCDIICNANGGVHGLIDCSFVGLTFGAPEELSCWTECIEEPSP